MKNLISILFIALSFYSCNDITDDSGQNCGSLTNVLYEGFSYCGNLKENPKQPSFIVVNSNDEMDKLFTKCETYAVALPDFTQKRILGLLAGPKPSSGYTIKIQSVFEDNCQIVVDYYETAPKPEDIVLTAITYPADYIVLPKSTKPILFSKVNKVVDYAIVGTYGDCVTADCYEFYRVENFKVLKYFNVTSLASDFNQLNYKALVFRDDYASFLSKIPTEIKDLKGQTKTFGSPNAHDQGGVYLEWSQSGVITKIYLDNDNTADQTTAVIAFKKVIQDKITELKTKS